MTDRSRSAQAILAIPFFDALMNQLESTAVDAAVNADYDDHAARQSHLAEVRAIRNLRSKLAVISQEDQAKVRKQAPA